MTKLELKIPQPGVTFYGNRRLTTVTILDIKVDDGVKEVFFEGLKDCDAIEVKIQNDCRCPSVERLYISENVRNISISNNTFPNVNRVVSDSKYFLSGNVLIEHYDVQDIYILKNTFCKKKGENIDLKNVNRIKDYAFVNCCSGNVTNVSEQILCDYKAFYQYKGIYQLPVVNGAHMLGNIMMTASDIIPARTTSINKDVDFSKKETVSLTDIKLVSQIYSANIPKRIYVDNEEPIVPGDIYNMCRYKFEWIDISPKNKYYTSIDGIIYTADKKILVRCPVGRTGRVVIPDGVTAIGHDAFRFCNISEAVIPDSVTEVGAAAFADSNIEKLTFGKGMTYISKRMFRLCRNLKHIHIPSNIKEIMSSAFSSCKAMEDIVLDEGVERIGPDAFEANTTNDIKISLPSSVRMIESGALRNIKNVMLTNKIPSGFFTSLYTSDSGADIHVNIGGKQYVLPSQSRFQEMDDYVSFLPINDRLLWQQYMYISDRDIMKRYKFIMRAYKAVNGNIEKQSKKEMLDMLRDNQKYIISNCCTYRYEAEYFIFMLSLDICTKQTIEKIISFADKTEGLSLKAYALDALNRMDTKTDFRI